jgi:hypothetical protein
VSKEMKIMRLDKNTNKEKRGISLSEAIKALNPFSTYRPILTYKGDPEQKRKLLLNYLRVLHIIVSASIPLSIIALSVILPCNGFIPHSESYVDIGVSIFVFYVFSILLMVLGYKWSYVYKWLDKHTNLINQITFNDSVWELVNGHLSRIGIFWVVVLFAFLMGMMGISWFAMIPLFAISGVAFILTYPTDTRVKKWVDELRTS